MNGPLIDDRAISVSGGTKSVRIAWPEGSEPPRAGLTWPLRATVELASRSVSPRAADMLPDLVEWFAGELDDVLVERLQRRWRQAKG